MKKRKAHGLPPPHFAKPKMPPPPKQMHIKAGVPKGGRAIGHEMNAQEEMDDRHANRGNLFGRGGAMSGPEPTEISAEPGEGVGASGPPGAPPTPPEGGASPPEGGGDAEWV